MLKYELKQRTGFLIRDIRWLLGKEEFKEHRDALFIMDRVEEFKRDIERRWYRKLKFWH